MKRESTEGKWIIIIINRGILKAAVTIGFMAFAIAKLPENNPDPMTMGQGWR